jgi:hypothetical protein
MFIYQQHEYIYIYIRATKPNLCVVFLCAHMSWTRNNLNSDELARENLNSFINYTWKCALVCQLILQLEIGIVYVYISTT